MLPLLSAGLIVMIGFGALLPVLPLYIQEHGMDAGQLGLIVAAWSFAKLIFEPIFGWWADRHSRKPQMVAGLFLLAIVSLLPLFFTSFAAFVSLRFLAGVATAMYDPAARGMVVEATDEDERGEAFGYYGAFSTGGFVIGPALGAIGAWLFDGYAFPFIITFLLALVGTAVIALYLSPNPHVVESPEFAHHPDALPLPAGDPFTASEVVIVPPDPIPEREQAPLRAIFNRRVIAALVLSFGLHLSFGTYEVIWSIYMIALGATVLWIGLTFVIFAIPEMIVGPIAGRYVDRHGPVRAVLGSGVIIIIAGSMYALARSPLVPTAVVPFEAAATAAMLPALYAILARGTPPGRASTAQGLFGAVATLALTVASIVAGQLFERGIGLPFWFFVAGMIVCLIAGLLIYRSAESSPTASASASA